MKHQVIYTSPSGFHRIIEVIDENSTFDDLCGDVFDPVINSDMDPDTLAKERSSFLNLVEREQVFGYELEIWDPAPGRGWRHLDSCFGFVGHYRPGGQFEHYIVNEMIQTAIESEAKNETK